MTKLTSGRFYLMVIFLISSCALMKKTPLDPSRQFDTETGFRFKIPQIGEWYAGKGQDFVIGKAPLKNGSTTVALVRHGLTTNSLDKVPGPKLAIKTFKEALIVESKSGRLTDVKNTFIEKQYKGAHCLTYKQTGVDGTMNISNDGMICLHPVKIHQYILMSMSERVPGTEIFSTTEVEKDNFFNTLDFN